LTAAASRTIVVIQHAQRGAFEIVELAAVAAPKNTQTANATSTNVSLIGSDRQEVMR
jgi:hypothetical protein